MRLRVSLLSPHHLMQTVCSLARQEATPRQRGARIDDLFRSRLVVNPRSDFRLLVVVTLAVVGYGEVSIVGHHLGIDNTNRPVSL